MSNRLMVTLQSSDNPYIKYPCVGEIELFELGSDGSVITGVFRGQSVDTPKKLRCPVVVKNPVFIYPATTH